MSAEITFNHYHAPSLALRRSTGTGDLAPSPSAAKSTSFTAATSCRSACVARIQAHVSQRPSTQQRAGQPVQDTAPASPALGYTHSDCTQHVSRTSAAERLTEVTGLAGPACTDSARRLRVSAAVSAPPAGIPCCGADPAPSEAGAAAPLPVPGVCTVDDPAGIAPACPRPPRELPVIWMILPVASCPCPTCPSNTSSSSPTGMRSMPRSDAGPSRWAADSRSGLTMVTSIEDRSRRPPFLGGERRMDDVSDANPEGTRHKGRLQWQGSRCMGLPGEFRAPARRRTSSHVAGIITRLLMICMKVSMKFSFWAMVASWLGASM